jgi:4-amino-4-deoxy-L-arabinose transferase-like glycosyltransferase
MRAPLALVVTAAVVAAALLLVATHQWGLGVSYDSVVYVQASHSLSSIPLPQPRDSGGEALYWWAPAYPLALKAFGSSYGAARLFNCLLLVAGTLLVAGVVWRSAGRTAAVIAAMLFAFSPSVFDAHLNLLAEPLFLVLAVAALGLVAERRATLAGVVSGAAVLTRYAGVPLILVGALFLRGPQRIRFLATSIAIYGAWLTRNQLAAGHTTGRELGWHPQGWNIGIELLRASRQLLLSPGSLPSVHVDHVGLLVQIGVAAALLAAIVRMRRQRPPRLVLVGLAFSGLYCLFLVVTVVMFDAETPVDQRLLVPLAPPLFFTLGWLFRRQPLLAAVPIAAFLLGTAQEVRTVSIYGLDYSGRTWSAARVDGHSLPAVPLYSNWPAAVAYFTGRSPMRLPVAVDRHTLAPNVRYQQQLQSLADAVHTGQAALVVLDDSFLQIPKSGPAITELPAFQSDCRPLTKVVDLCASP